MPRLISDLRYALRSLRKSPGFTAAAVLTLALGIGANTAVFSVIKSVLLTPLPYRDPGRLVAVWEHSLVRNYPHNVVNPRNYLDWKARSHSFTDLGLYTWAEMTLTGGSVAERVSGRAVTPNLFPVLGVAPALGRGFTKQEGLPNGPRVVILSDGLWRRKFAADPHIVGRTIATAGGGVTVVGVMPPGFRPLGDEAYWAPFPIDPDNQPRRGRYAMVIGRLRPGITATAAQADLASVMVDLAREDPFDAGWSADVIPLGRDVAGSAARTLWILMGAVVLVLLITCANVANLTLSRALGRRHEQSVRSALGASGWDLARQAMIETLTLAVAGGALGLVFAEWAVHALGSLRPGTLPRVAPIGIDLRVLAVTALASITVGLLVGFPVLFQRRGTKPAGALYQSGGRTTEGQGPARLRGALVIAQLALALMLLAGAGLLLQSLRRLNAVTPGFDPHDLLTVEVDLPLAAYQDRSRQSAFFAELANRVRNLPGVQQAGLVSYLPLTGLAAATSYRVVGRPEPAPGHQPVADIRIVDPGYLGAMRIPVLRGRGFTEADRGDTRPVILVSRRLAEEQWPGEDPVGRQLLVSWWGEDTARQVVGVVGDVHHAGLDAVEKATIYYPEAQEPSSQMTLVIRSKAGTGTLAAAVRRDVQEIDRAVPVDQPATMYTVLARSMDDRRYPLLLLAVFAGLAVALAAVGIYGVLSFAVSRRVREIGIRIALGATTRSVRGMMLREGALLASIGVALGLLGGMLVTRTLRRLLFETVPGDPQTLGLAAGIVFGVALLAVYLPARRATRVDPVEALRVE